MWWHYDYYHSDTSAHKRILSMSQRSIGKGVTGSSSRWAFVLDINKPVQLLLAMLEITEHAMIMAMTADYNGT